MKLKYTDEFITQSHTDYLVSGMSAAAFAKTLGCDGQRLRNSWKAHNLPLKRKSNTCPNESFFEVIETEIQAYLLGFFASDGHIEKRQDYSSYTLKWDISSYDEEVLYLINEHIGNNYYKVFRLKDRYISGITITSKKLGEDLLRLGYDNRKTDTCYTIPSLNKKLTAHFIRGYFDGDGSVGGPSSITNTNRWFSLSAKNIEVLSTIRQELPSELKWYDSWSSHQILDTGAPADAWTISCRSRQDLDKIYNYLYTDANYYLKRKKLAFIQAIR